MESVSRISSLLETDKSLTSEARDLTLEAARDVDPRKIGRVGNMSTQQIKKLLDGRSERDVLDGLRRVVAMQYAQPPQPTLPFFPAVLKTLSNPYPSTRPLVYSYLLHHADADPDTALLAVNTIQKSLAESNPRVRAMALKTMAGIRVPVLSQIVGLAIKRGTADLSPLVRKAAALSCVKCVRLDPATRPQIEDYLATLLADKQYYVAGSAVQAFAEICPERLGLIHPVYRNLCKMIVDMDEWGQLATMRVLIFYSRKCFPQQIKKVKRVSQTQEDKTRDFYNENPSDEAVEYDDVEVLDPDLKLFLDAIKPLLQSRNSAVILTVAKAYFYLSPAQHLNAAIGPLITLLRASQDTQSVVLHNIVQVAILRPDLFAPYMRHFLLRSDETPIIRRLKLEVLTLVFPHLAEDNQNLILAELEHFSHSHDVDLVRDSVRAIGQCAQHGEAPIARRCLTLLLRQIRSTDAHLVGEAIDVVRHLIQRSPAEQSKTIVRLAKNLDSLTSPTARASVVWLVGEFAAESGEEGIAPDVLRLLIRGYADEDDIVKAQIVLLAAKVYLHYLNARNAKNSVLKALNSGQTESADDGDQVINHNDGSLDKPQDAIPLLFDYTMLLARYTPSYDLRDCARTYRALLSQSSSTELATLLLLAPKPVPLTPSLGDARKTFTFGSVSLLIGETLSSRWNDLPDWVAAGDEPDPRLRDVPGAEDSSAPRDGSSGTAAVGSAGRKLDEVLRQHERNPIAREVALGTGQTKKGKTLDDWLDDDEDDDENASSEESESESGESESGESESSEYETDSEEEDDEDEEEHHGGQRRS